jgi:hypothetical protein
MKSPEVLMRSIAILDSLALGHKNPKISMKYLTNSIERLLGTQKPLFLSHIERRGAIKDSQISQFLKKFSVAGCTHTEVNCFPSQHSAVEKFCTVCNAAITLYERVYKKKVFVGANKTLYLMVTSSFSSNKEIPYIHRTFNLVIWYTNAWNNPLDTIVNHDVIGHTGSPWIGEMNRYNGIYNREIIQHNLSVQHTNLVIWNPDRDSLERVYNKYITDGSIEYIWMTTGWSMCLKISESDTTTGLHEEKKWLPLERLSDGIIKNNINRNQSFLFPVFNCSKREILPKRYFQLPKMPFQSNTEPKKSFYLRGAI